VRAGPNLRAVVVVAAFSAGLLGTLTTAPLSIGIVAAEARDYYTRKRVNGRWITGHFPRQPSASGRSKAGLEPRPTSPQLSDDLPTPWPSLALQPAQRVKPNLVLATATAPEGGLPSLFEELPSRALALAATQDERLLKLREALHAHARTLASDAERASGALSGPGDSSSPRLVSAPPEPKSVLFDFQLGVKTTVFADGTSVEERFDPASVKGLGGDHPVRPLSGSQR
jgi:hypothetical protein